MTNAIIEKLNLDSSKRVIVISDIHANKNYLEKLLKNVKLTKQDVLLFLGDLTEKGKESLNTLHYIMGLAEEYETYFVQGNCDHLFYRDFSIESELDSIYVYIMSTPNSLWWEMFNKLNLTVKTKDDFRNAIPKVFQAYNKEIMFLENMPQIIDTDKITFVHAGLDSLDYTSLSAKSCRKNDAFMLKNTLTFPKWIVVGHWPVSNYNTTKLACNPVFDMKHHIISIDGGNSIKSFGQLNALIIHDINNPSFEYTCYEENETMIIEHDQEEKESNIPPLIGNNEVIKLEESGMFTRVKDANTGYSFTLPTYKIFKKDGKLYNSDHTNYLLELKKGEQVFCYAQNNEYILIKKNGILGWYKK